MSKKCTCSSSKNLRKISVDELQNTDTKNETPRKFIDHNTLIKHTRRDRKKISEEELNFMMKTTSSQIDTNSAFVLEKIFNPNFLKVIMRYLEI